MAIKYREHIDADGVHREWADANGVVHRELMTQSAEFIESHQFTWERLGLREQRNAYLTATDWTLLPDSPLTSDQQSEATQYRQMLRDFPENYTDVFEAKDAINNLRPENTLSFLK